MDSLSLQVCMILASYSFPTILGYSYAEFVVEALVMVDELPVVFAETEVVEVLVLVLVD